MDIVSVKVSVRFSVKVSVRFSGRGRVSVKGSAGNIDWVRVQCQSL
jgi:hypothetical protein